MQVSGIGGAATSGGGIAGLTGAAGSASGAGGIAGLSGSGGNLDIQGGLPAGLRTLVGTLQDFSTAEILLALMLASAAGRDDDCCDSGGAALGFLAGLALAGQLGQSNQFGLQFNAAASLTGTSSGNGAGLSIDVQA